jgi:hypothetical protein
MRKYAIYTIIFIVVLLTNSVYAAIKEEGETVTKTPQNQFEETFKNVQGVEAGGVNSFQQNADGTYSLNVNSYTKDGATYKNGVNVVVDSNGKLIHADKITLPSGATVENADMVSSSGKDNYQAGRVGELREGPIILSNAQNVQWNNGVMTASSADSMDYKGSTSNDVIMLVADNKQFSVEKASAVQAGCFLVEDVNDAQFNVGRIMTMTTSGSGKVVYDQGQKVDYTAKDLNSSIVGSITACRRPTYQVKAMELNTKTGNLTELVNGSGEIQLDGRYGVVCMNLTPVSTYDIDTGRFEYSFGFIIKEYAYKLCIQKAVSQQLVSDCPLCGLVDLANQKLLLNGVIEYTRYVYDSALIDANKRTAFKSMGFGKNVIDLAAGEVMIETDAPEIYTVPSNYLELREIKEPAGTHRFLGINEKLDRVSRNWDVKYTASYSDSTTTITDNLLDYKRGLCHVTVLPPDSSQIASIMSSLNEQKARFL